MDAHFRITGSGYALGDITVRNADVASSLGIAPDWFEKHTGIVERRVCSPQQTVLDLAAKATNIALADARLEAAELGNDTILLYIQNGYTHLTPPPAILLSHRLGLRCIKPLSFDGVCAEPIAALEIAALHLRFSSCKRAIIVAAVDFLPTIDPKDKETVGLFGAGAGAIILEPVEPSVPEGLHALAWRTDTSQWDHGIIPLRGYKQNAHGLHIDIGYYEMNGRRLAKGTLAILPKILEEVLSRAKWSISDVDLFITHQPNLKLLEIGIRQLGIERERVPIPVCRLGNMGPASILVSLGLAKEEGRLPSGTKVLLIAFGLGLSCGAAALTV